MNWKALAAEFIGTFALVFVGVGATVADYLSGGASGLVGIALAHGLVLAVMVSVTASTSGGHLNPAVTMGAWVTGKIGTPNALGYMLVQCLGGIVAAFALRFVVPVDALAAVNVGTPALGKGVTVFQGLMTEGLLTFFLMFVVYGAAIDQRAPTIAGLLIGLTFTLDILVGGPVSGGSVNPARHLGPALMGGGLDNLWLYWVGPFIGASLAALLYKGVFEKR